MMKHRNYYRTRVNGGEAEKGSVHDYEGIDKNEKKNKLLELWECLNVPAQQFVQQGYLAGPIPDGFPISWD